MPLRLLFGFFAILFFGSIIAQTPSIRVKIDNYDRDTILLANFFGDKQFIRDTAVIGQDGWYEFSRDTVFEQGIYLVVLPPDNQYFQLMMDETQRFSVETEKGDEVAKMKIDGSLDNQLFYDYLQYLNKMRPRAEAINAKKEGVADEEKIAKLDEELSKLNDEVQAYQDKIITDHATTLTAALIRSNKNPEIPEFADLPEEEQRERQWRWMQQHYFDNIDLGDPRLIRTPFLQQRVDYYINNLTTQDPDTLIQAIDYILEQTRPAATNFQYFLSNFLNTYAASKIVGQDAIYVHLVNQYYAKGDAPGLEEETLTKIKEEARKMEPVLLGNDAPEIILQDKDGNKVNVREVDADYTVLIFWRPGCGACKKAAEPVLNFAKKYKDQKVKVLSICTKFTDEVPLCWEFIEEKGWQDDVINLVDPYHRSRFNVKYNVTGTPRIFILDRDKKIAIKGIGAEQLDEVMEKIIEME